LCFEGSDMCGVCSNLGDSTPSPAEGTSAQPTDAVQDHVDAAIQNAVHVAEANRTDAQKTLNELKGQIS